jgi:NAD(P)-dependent dehydrogenase (short-subunit alcohol dehydrogenase family)
MENSLKDKKILVVGGSSGIGLAVAKFVYKLGARVVIASRSAAAKHDSLTGEIGEDIETISFDITSADKIEAMAKAAGRVDHFVIAVRPDIKPALFQETSLENAREAFDNKFWGTYQLIRKTWNHIGPGGSIIMTTGIAGEKVFKGSSTMGFINGALEALCRSLAVELAPIRVNAVSPGFVEPKSREAQERALQFPVPRLATQEEIAQAYVYLMMNDYVTGTTMVVDAGARLI